MIIIEPLAGLGNRMRAINSARALSVHLKTRCVILWINDWNNCNCRYSDLFLKAESTWLVEGSFANWITPLSPVFYHKKLDYSEVAQKINDTDFFESWTLTSAFTSGRTMLFIRTKIPVHSSQFRTLWNGYKRSPAPSMVQRSESISAGAITRGQMNTAPRKNSSAPWNRRSVRIRL